MLQFTNTCSGVVDIRTMECLLRTYSVKTISIQEPNFGNNEVCILYESYFKHPQRCREPNLPIAESPLNNIWASILTPKIANVLIYLNTSTTWTTYITDWYESSMSYLFHWASNFVLIWFKITSLRVGHIFLLKDHKSGYMKT